MVRNPKRIIPCLYILDLVSPTSYIYSEKGVKGKERRYNYKIDRKFRDDTRGGTWVDLRVDLQWSEGDKESGEK